MKSDELRFTELEVELTDQNLALKDEIERLNDLASCAITILMNVDGGDFKQTDEWVAAFRKWRLLYTQKQEVDDG